VCFTPSMIDPLRRVRILLRLLWCQLDLSFRDQLSNQANRVSIGLPNNTAKSRVISMGRISLALGWVHLTPSSIRPCEFNYHLACSRTSCGWASDRNVAADNSISGRANITDMEWSTTVRSREQWSVGFYVSIKASGHYIRLRYTFFTAFHKIEQPTSVDFSLSIKSSPDLILLLFLAVSQGPFWKWHWRTKPNIPLPLAAR
jgi:hypothetical protein